MVVWGKELLGERDELYLLCVNRPALNVSLSAHAVLMDNAIFLFAVLNFPT